MAVLYKRPNVIVKIFNNFSFNVKQVFNPFNGSFTKNNNSIIAKSVSQNLRKKSRELEIFISSMMPSHLNSKKISVVEVIELTFEAGFLII